LPAAIDASRHRQIRQDFDHQLPEQRVRLRLREARVSPGCTSMWPLGDDVSRIDPRVHEVDRYPERIPVVKRPWDDVHAPVCGQQARMWIKNPDVRNNEDMGLEDPRAPQHDHVGGERRQAALALGRVDVGDFLHTTSEKER
jgi:hypothetical protein